MREPWEVPQNESPSLMGGLEDVVPEGTASKGVEKPRQQERNPPGHPLSVEWLHWASQLKVSVPSVPLIRSRGNSWTIRPARAKVGSG